MDFEAGTIVIRYSSTDYGPHAFDLENALPSGATLSSVTVRSFVGRVTEDDDLTDETESTSELIDAALTAISGK